MTELKTRESLLNALRQSSKHVPTADELLRQRVSFIMGSLKKSSDVTRAKIQEVLDQREGRKRA